MLVSQVSSVYKKRREQLLYANPASAFLFPSHPLTLRNPDVHYPWRQESNFFYLSGFEEPESCLLLVPDEKDPAKPRTILFVMERHKKMEIWTGERFGVDRAQKIFGADEAYPIGELKERLPKLLKRAERLYYRMHLDERMDRGVLGALETHRSSQGRSGRGILPIQDPMVPLGEMRLFKSKEEVEDQRKACQITAQAHRQAMQVTRPGMNEFEIEALINYEFRRSGCAREGYGSIVAGGKNACCLHYVSNNEELKDGDLLLIDAGGEYNYYTADITRTFPVGKKFTPTQAKVYDLVLLAQKEAIAVAKPGKRFDDIHQRACEVLVEGLMDWGILKGATRDELIDQARHSKYYPHRTGHWLGIDVHDVGAYSRDGDSRQLEPGMILTVEPGLYFQPDETDYPEEFRGIGIRIEDDVLITAGGNEVLTQDVPKERSEIEALRSAGES